MKSVFIAYDQALKVRVLSLLDHMNCRGYSVFPQVQGRGTKTGDPHMGSHAWPTMNSAILTIVEDDQVDALLNALHALDLESEMLGLRAFVWDIERTI